MKIKLKIDCPYCFNVSEFEINEYTDSNVICPKCFKTFYILYSEDCTDDYSDCWDNYFSAKNL